MTKRVDSYAEIWLAEGLKNRQKSYGLEAAVEIETPSRSSLRSEQCDRACTAVRFQSRHCQVLMFLIRYYRRKLFAESTLQSELEQNDSGRVDDDDHWLISWICSIWLNRLFRTHTRSDSIEVVQ
jgi:hypothetical protein